MIAKRHLQIVVCGLIALCTYSGHAQRTCIARWAEKRSCGRNIGRKDAEGTGTGFSWEEAAVTVVPEKSTNGHVHAGSPELWRDLEHGLDTLGSLQHGLAREELTTQARATLVLMDLEVRRLRALVGEQAPQPPQPRRQN